MADEVRTVLKNFNRDLLTEELAASVLPFESLFLAGFEKLNPFVGTPTAAPRLISRDGVSGVEDFADPGEIRFVFTSALTVPQGAILDGLLNSHDATQHTTDQDNQQQDETDLTILEAAWPNWTTFTPTQKDDFLRRLSRVVLREARQSDF